MEANKGKHSAAVTCLQTKYEQIHNLSMFKSIFQDTEDAKSVFRVLLYPEYSKVWIISSHFLSKHK